MSVRILYCDDEAALREVVSGQLGEKGFSVETAADGVEAIEKLGKNPPYDLVLLDINMPGKTGIEVLKYIRETGLTCRTIMLTGRVGFKVATESLQLGAKGYVTKSSLDLKPDGHIDKASMNIDFLLATIQRVMGS
jgi:two-component system, cell cycle sensor histidine kinase and response regulator CckA